MRHFGHFAFPLTILCLLAAWCAAPARAAADDALKPLRPPAVPLVACDPYLSVWSFNDRLTDGDTRHWTGKPHTLIGLVRIDGKPYRLMGAQPADVPALEQTDLKVLPTRTVYTFKGGGVVLALTFTTPMLPDDIDVLSRPLTYVAWTASATDGKSHDVSALLGAGADLAVNTPDQAVTWGREKFGDLTALKIGSEAQPVLQAKGDNRRIDWGYLYLAAPGAQAVAVAPAEEVTKTFAASGNLPEKEDARSPRPVQDGLPTAAVVVDLGQVAAQPVERHALAAYDDLYSITYFHKKLRPYWRRNGMDAGQLLRRAEKEYGDLSRRCEKFDDDLTAAARQAGGEEYARICALAYRQGLAGNKVVADADGEAAMPLVFPKENFSNGCIATVDVIYPMEPQFLLFSPALAKGSLATVLNYAASDRWKFPFAPHDLGTYPVANGQVYGGGERTEVNQMPVEESGNMLVLLAALAKVEGNADFAGQYWPQLAKWANYLEQKGFDPENQLCTDDFAGHLAHNTNLSIKAIEGLGSYALLCQMRGEAGEAARVRKLAEQFAARWVKEADDGDHTRLTFDKPGTWSQKYNLVWDKLLGLNLFPPAVAEKEIAFYLSHPNRYGLPLDSRKEYTKLDWTIWTATMAGRRQDFEAIVAPVYRFLDESATRVPMCDWYSTQKGTMVGFQARPVVGGVFIKLLADDATWKAWAGRGQKLAGKWAPMPTPPQVKAVVPASQKEGIVWRYSFDKPAGEWFTPGYDASAWKQGPAGFGTAMTPGAVVRTEWKSSDIYLRREFDLPAADVARLQLLVHHDDDVEIYLNGVLAAKAGGYVSDYEPMDIQAAARAALKPGKNTLAVHCHQVKGGQYIDVGVIEVKE